VKRCLMAIHGTFLRLLGQGILSAEKEYRPGNSDCHAAAATRQPAPGPTGDNPRSGLVTDMADLGGEP
jgi:hypothetical protein